MKRRRAIALVVVTFILIGLMAAPLWGYAESKPKASQVVKVGCAGIRGFMETPDGTHATGYGTAYLDAIAKETGWEYVYVNGSWAECLSMLKSGEIDILLPVVKDEGRKDSFIFSKLQCCMNYVGLYTARERDDLYLNDYESFNGMRVGMVKDNCISDYFAEQAEKKGFDFVPVFYDSEMEVENALKRGDVDAVVNGNLGPSSWEKVLSKLGVLPGYFMMDQSNAALMKQLDDAMEAIRTHNPYFEAETYAQYYNGFDTMVESWTREEAEFIKNCPTLRVLCDADSNPIEWLDRKTGEYKGIYVEIMRLIQEESGLDFEFVSPTDITDPWQAVENGEGDLLLAAYGNEALEEAYNMCFTIPYYPEKNSIIGRRGRNFDPAGPMKIAQLDSFISTQYYIKETHPQWEIIPCTSLEECMRAVDEGQADITMTDTITLPYNNYLGDYPTLSVVSTMAEEGIPIGIGISKSRDFDYRLLQSVLNKATLRLSGEKVNSYVLGYTIERAAQVHLMDLFRSKPIEFFAVVIMLLAILFGTCSQIYGNRLKTRQNSELENKNALLNNAVLAAEHARDMYDALYNMAVCGIGQFEVRRNGHTTMMNANNEGKAILAGDREADYKKLFNTDLRRRIYDKDQLQVHRALTSLLHPGDKGSMEFRIMRGDKKIIWIRASIEWIATIENESKIIQSTFMDITESKAMEEQLKNRSERDSLTGLYNKGAMERYSRDYLEHHREKPCVYCIMDIDNFKEINDTYGHWNGDQVLKEASQIIRSVVRGKGILGRFGGDELVILFQDIDKEEAGKQIQLICNKLNRILVGDIPGLVSGSMGVAVGTGNSYEQLFENADKALYMAKQEGKNCVRFSE